MIGMQEMRQMSNIDDFFAGPSGPSDPRLRDWKRRIEAGASANLELYHPAASFGLSPTKMVVHFADYGKSQPIEEVDWDEQLNEGLIQLHIRAVGHEQESERFAMGLRDGLRSVEREFGNGYFNAVLLDLVVKSHLNDYPEIAEVLKFTYHDKTDRSSRSYQRCREAIALGISARAKELTEGYAIRPGRSQSDFGSGDCKVPG
jgi:hypothetical protein